MASERINFSPRAKLISALGEDLISSDTVAIIELVKNAYDADAEHVSITLFGPLEPGDGRIEILDDGSGMSLETVKGSWAQPATGYKRGVKRSDSKARRILGEKGIGRFAAQRLGHQLALVTRMADEAEETELVVDWDEFDDETKMLSQVWFTAERRAARSICRDGNLGVLWREHGSRRRTESGTLIRIDKLRHEWRLSHIQQLQRGLSRLIAPSFIEKADFSVWLTLPAPFGAMSGKIEPPAVLDHPRYMLRGKRSKSGEVSLELHVQGLKKSRTLSQTWYVTKHEDGRDVEVVASEDPKDDLASLHCGPLEFELRVWDREESDLRPIAKDLQTSVREVRRDLDEMAGISIYRDGFRVLPFGEPGDDWLNLDMRRVQNPTMRISNNQIVGVIGIRRDANSELRDQTNRQGLIDNDAFVDLRRFLIRALSWLEEQRYDVRQPARESRRGSTALFDRAEIQELRAYASSAHREDRRLLKLVEKVESRTQAADTQTQAAIARYRRLANLGVLIDKVVHDVRTPVSKIRSEAQIGKMEAKAFKGTVSEHCEKARVRFVSIDGYCGVLETVARRLVPLGGRKPGRPRDVVFEQIIAGAFDFFKEEIAELGIEVTLPLSQNTVTVEPGEVTQVFYNLVDNSVFWLRRTQREDRAIKVDVRRRGTQLIVDFCDSGPGIPSDHRDRIFEPYFSTKPDGTGLGLAIAGEIVEDYYGGAFELLDGGELPGACFRLTFRKRV